MKRKLLIVVVLAVAAYLIYRVVKKKAGGAVAAGASSGTIPINRPPVSIGGITPPDATYFPYAGRFVQGTYGEEVRYLQQYLVDRGQRIAVDGVLGPQTADAMQREFGTLVLTEAEFEDHTQKNPTTPAAQGVAIADQIADAWNQAWNQGFPF